MAILKCKMCGGNLNINEGVTVCECEYCGTKQTVPTVDDEKKLNLFGRANRLRFACEFDKAAGVYESIVADFPEEAEAYWGLVLCKYGIEYVDDPATAKKVPTCHRSSFESVMDDSNFELVMENADAVARAVYREQAKQIEELRKGIIEVSSKEEPYDIFICYKETAENGDRTIDSVIAQDVYTELTNKGYRVFFSRITLEDKLGVEYEPYIFAALNSAKIMLAFGTDYEYYNAVWVKNEWSRFLQLIAKGEKKTLIPCYKGIDAYDMPKEFAKLQAQDMGKVGAIQDLLRGIEKILPKETAKTETVVVQQSANNPSVDSLLERAFMFLEDRDWKSADEYCEKVLDIDPKCAKAYLGKLMAYLEVEKQEKLKYQYSFSENDNYKKAIKYADKKLKSTLEGYLLYIKNEQIYSDAIMLSKKEDIHSLNKSINLFRKIIDYKDSKELKDQVETKRKNITEKYETKKQFYKNESEKAFIRNSQTNIAAGCLHTVGLKSDGTVVSLGDNEYKQCLVSNWISIEAIFAGSFHTVGLKSDGTVVATGNNDNGKCNVSAWTDIVQISAGDYHTVGLKANGTVVAVGENSWNKCNVSTWTDIVAIAAGGDHTIGLKSDGTVVATGDTTTQVCAVTNWEDIVQISAGTLHTVGLKADGTVVASGYGDDGQCKVSRWKDIVRISAGDYHTVGLKANGTVVATGQNEDGECNVFHWKDIVAIAAGGHHTIGLKSDGTVVATGRNNFKQCDVSKWENILVPIFAETKTEYEVEKKRRLEEQKRIAEQKAKHRSEGVCQHCGGAFKGLFIKKCTNCGKTKDY